MSRGPLTGLRVLEFASIGPGPHCAMLLSDLGAEVVRLDRAGGNGWPNPIMDRGRAAIEIDLKSEAGRKLCLATAASCDVVIEGFRPGVMERLGLGPEVLVALNPRLIYGRMTGWGQTGPLAKTAGHDVNYIALTGALAAMGKPGEPATPPLNLVGDFGGGSMFLAFGIMAALWERERSGKGQVVDAAILDGVASMMTMFAGLTPASKFSTQRGHNMLGGAAPFYRCYTCADGLDVAIGPLEPHFYSELLTRIGAPKELLDHQQNAADWDRQSDVLAAIFATKTRSEWCEMFDGTDACLTPVLSLAEAAGHAQMQARQTYVEHNGLLQAAPAPRFSRTPGTISETTDGAAMLARWGLSFPDR
jgi:alpha-methylacyl-CoA racemase